MPRPPYVRTMAISIHALRMERDSKSLYDVVGTIKFQSTRSAWSATSIPGGDFFDKKISIHALRMERDRPAGKSPARHPISIHALRMERDGRARSFLFRSTDFNPRAPHGARRARHQAPPFPARFQSTRSAWSATISRRVGVRQSRISIHALRMERDA